METAVHALDAFMTAMGAPARRVAPGEWGLAVECEDGTLDIGIAVRDGRLRAQAWIAEAGLLDRRELLHRNRVQAFARFSESRAGEVHLEADLPAEAVSAVVLDRLLAAFVDAALDARASAYAVRRERSR